MMEQFTDEEFKSIMKLDDNVMVEGPDKDQG